MRELLDVNSFNDVQNAIALEYRASRKIINFRCSEVEIIDSSQNLYRLEIVSRVAFDWSWEGATAWRDEPLNAQWRGEIVELDETNGHIYVVTEDSPPCLGEFFVRAFGFLEALYKIYKNATSCGIDLILRYYLPLTRGQGNIKDIENDADQGVFDHLWSKSWSILWGPPGTGKTYSIGQQVACCLNGSDEKILVVSTTNKATDGVAISIGRHGRQKSLPVEQWVRRLGSGSDIKRYAKNDLEDLLEGSAAVMRRDYSVFKAQHEATQDPTERAKIAVKIKDLRQALSECSLLNSGAKVVVTTSFMALSEAAKEDTTTQVAKKTPPFTTIIIDEAGLISRAAIAAMAGLASRRVILVGDPRQLSPISKMSRVLSSDEAIWLAESGLAHLNTKWISSGIHLLQTQYRMHPDIREVVSNYQYDNQLMDSETVKARQFLLDDLLTNQPRAIWYVLDEEISSDSSKLPKIRSDRGPGNKSWIRHISEDILAKIFRYHPKMKEPNEINGLFISPFVAQTRIINRFFKDESINGWVASTAHKQQGAEAPYIIFDTVNAGSTGWSDDEWRRLINVGISRAEQFLIVLASRLEMQQPYMRDLVPLLAPRVLRGVGGQMRWQEVPGKIVHTQSAIIRSERPWTLGAQIESRRQMQPIFSEEQERLCIAKLDGGPRLVRGVAGSGKSVVLAHWLARTLASPEEKSGMHWVIYGNLSLKPLLDETIADAWKNLNKDGQLIPSKHFEVHHIEHLIDLLETELMLRKSASRGEQFDYDLRSLRLLNQLKLVPLKARVRSVFIDEAQDLGEYTLKLLSHLVIQRDKSDPNSKAINIFYDNAQNIYKRKTPDWKTIGLDMRGRSTVMKESFRATRPIAEFALNVLARLRPLDNDSDYKELVKNELVNHEQRNNRSWINVNYNHIDGPNPIFRSFSSRTQEVSALISFIARLVRDDGVRPNDIRVIVLKKKDRAAVCSELAKELHQYNILIEEQASQTYSKDESTLVVTTVHSMKGYESEIVCVYAADAFSISTPKEQAQSSDLQSESLYVALTRARSLLYVSSTISKKSLNIKINDALLTSYTDISQYVRDDIDR